MLLIGVTKVPACARTSIRPSSSTFLTASRTGVREVPRRSAISISLTEEPGASLPVTMARRTSR